MICINIDKAVDVRSVNIGKQKSNWIKYIVNM